MPNSRFAFVLLLISALFTQTLGYTPGSLDTSFGTNGVVTSDVSMTGSSDRLNDVKIQSDGKIVGVGFGGHGSEDLSPFAVVRYNSNGTLDSSFDNDGIANTTIQLTSAAKSLAIQSDGKIIVAGFSGPNFINPQFTLVRYNTNGSLDTTFDGDGIVIAPRISVMRGDIADGVTIQPDGKIVVVGTTFPGDFDNAYLVMRFNSNGSLDTSFGNNGVVTTNPATTSDSAFDVVTQPDGKIVLIGSASSHIAVVRYNSNGSLDASFDSDGIVNTPIGSVSEPRAITLQSDGKIMAAGYANVGFFQFAVIRYNSTGSLDMSFDNDGIATVPVRTPNGSDIANDLSIQSDGKIVIGGVSRNSNLTEIDFGLIRLNSNGSLDTNFGNGGKIVISIDSGIHDSIEGIAIQSDGKIVAAGGTRTTVGFTDFVVCRFQSDGSRFFDYDGDGKTDLSVFRPAPGEWWYLKSSNGGNFAATFGASSDKITPADYTGDGKSDFTFFRPSTGFWFILRSENLSFFAFPFGTGTDIPVPADYEGDGKVDAAVFRPSSNTWFIQKSSGGTDIIIFGASGDKPVPADYDGDGKADIAIFRPNGASGAEWWIRRSSNSSVFAAAFGSSTDKPTQGDFTGDGKADIAFFRPSNGNWFILRSEDSSFYAFPFGASGDVPVAGDYDGDGRFDAGVFRPSNSTWFVQRSTAGTLIQTFGISGDLPTPNAFVP